jgi:hypothetical protein
MAKTVYSPQPPDIPLWAGGVFACLGLIGMAAVLFVAAVLVVGWGVAE